MSTAGTNILPSTIFDNSLDDKPNIYLEPELKDQLKSELNLNNDQLNALITTSGHDILNEVMNPIGLNKEVMAALDSADKLSPITKELVNIRAPIAMTSEVSNPNNWQKDQYIGPGSMFVNNFINPTPLELPVDDFEPPINLKKVSIDALVMSVLTKRAEIIEVQLRDQISSIQLKNSELEVSNDFLARSKEGKANAGDNTSTFTDEFIEYWESIGAEYQRSDRDGGVPGLQHRSADWDVNIEGLKAKIEALTSQSQLETTKLQQTINKFNQAFEMLSNFINKYYQSINTIIQNLR
ncbi:MAG: hypothetical protein PUP46_07860 [Endozoicomonas sp. (ex Botrylloides leachii)]|nr:hypothetical protein [Endozoicomonas sp. (ex Botrylloides leachii)]